MEGFTAGFDGHACNNGLMITLMLLLLLIDNWSSILVEFVGN